MDHNTARPPGGGTSRKRKFREGETSTSSNDDTIATSSKNNNNIDKMHAQAEQSSDNKILAGYLAYEFLRNGTLLGERFGNAKQEVMGRKSFEELASILKADGVHIPGIFNPSQLARWIGI